MRGRITAVSVLALVSAGSLSRPLNPSKSRAIPPSLVALRSQANALLNSGEYSRALSVYNQGYTAALRLGDKSTAARFISGAGSAQFVALRYRHAVRAYLEARRLAREAGDGEALAGVSVNLSSLYLQQNDLNAALHSATEGLHWLQRFPASKYLPRLLLQSAVLNMRVGRMGIARGLFRDAAQAAENQGDFDTVALVWNQCGYEFLRGGRLEAAEAALLEAYRLNQLRGLREIWLSYYALGALYLAKGEARFSGVLLDRAVELLSNAPSPMPLWRLYHQRGRARLAVGRLQDALADLEKAAESAFRQRAELTPSDSVWVGLGAEQGDLYTALIEAYEAAYRLTGNVAYAVRALDAQAESRAIGLRFLIHTPSDWGDRLPQEYWEVLAQLRAAEAELLRGSNRGGAEKADALVYKLTEMEAATGLEPTLVPRGRLRSQDTLARLREAIGPQGALLNFHLGEPNSYRWVLTAGILQLNRLAPRGKLVDLASRFRQAVALDSLESVSLGEELYRELFGALPGDALQKSRWALCLDGELLEAPLAALVVGREEGRPVYVVERHSTRIVPSIDLLERRPSLSWDGPFVGIGDPVYNTADDRWSGLRARRYPPGSGSYLPGLLSTPVKASGSTSLVLARLAGSGPEIEACATAWLGEADGAILLRGAEASIQRLRLAMDRAPAILHFATHFLQSPGALPRANLILSLGPDGVPESLGPAEVSRWRHGLGLVVLSGCSSARAGILPSEGLMGMTRAWLAAGAHSVVASLWPVPDDSGMLFVSFYKRLGQLRSRQEGGAAADALRLAQLDLLASGGWHARPARWAAYFVVGKE